MVDSISPAERSAVMSRVRSSNTRPELIVRRLLHAMGYRYRLHAPDLPGRPDVVFRGRRKAIFIHGCFWHQHPDPTCALARQPKSRHEFWLPKFAANVGRDERVLAELADLGWSVFVVWECRLRDKSALEDALRGFLENEVS